MGFDPQVVNIATGSITANTAVNITVIWPAALNSDNSYSVAVSVADPTGFLVVQNYAFLQNGTGILVKVLNLDSVPHTGNVTAIGIAPTTIGSGLQNQIDLLTVRLSAIDGQGLSDPSLAIDTVLANSISGLNTTLVSSVLLMEKLYQTLLAQVNTLQATVNSIV